MKAVVYGPTAALVIRSFRVHKCTKKDHFWGCESHLSSTACHLPSYASFPFVQAGCDAVVWVLKCWYQLPEAYDKRS